MLKYALCLSGGIFALSLLSSAAFTAGDIWINVSDSLPPGIYRTAELTGSPPQRGELILSCLPPATAVAAFDRGYISAGRCSGKTAPVGKYLAAVPGDRIQIDARGVRVNGSYLEYSRPQSADNLGRPLPALQLELVLAADEYLLVNPRLNSFDSRYIGIVQGEFFLARLQQFLTWEQS